MGKFYTGIGSRQTPPHILTIMSKIATKLQTKDWTLRSGAAAGADTAFESSAGTQTQIFLPWKRFNNHSSELSKPTHAAFEMASNIHPNWAACSPGARKLHARNCHQLLGIDLNTPSKLVICWTVNGHTTGGTGTAIRLAQTNNIPVFNLATCTIEEIAMFTRSIR